MRYIVALVFANKKAAYEYLSSRCVKPMNALSQIATLRAAIDRVPSQMTRLSTQ